MKTPKRGKKYKEIIDHGCGGYQTYEGDYNCHHRYEWECDICPCCIEYQKNKSNEHELIDLTSWLK